MLPGGWGRLGPALPAQFRRCWSFEDAEQWGEPFLILGGDGADLQFQE